MTLFSLLLVMATLWLPQPAPFSRATVLPLLVTMVATWLVTVTRAWPAMVSRIIDVVLLAQIHILVGLTGEENSVYVVLYLGLLMYGAMFYGGAGMMAIYCLVAVAMFLPGLFAGDLSLASFSREIVQLAIWTLVAVATYALTGHLRQISRTDALTGLINHGAFWEQAQAEHERSERYGRPYTVLLADIDHFKRTNDAYGHRTGDRVLNEVAQVLSSRVRTGDIVARYGGEEFAVLLPETGADDARSVAEELRRQVAAKVVSPSATLSIGLASNEGDAAGRDLDSVVQAADAAMYEAKGGGRNRVRGGYVKSQ